SEPVKRSDILYDILLRRLIEFRINGYRKRFPRSTLRFRKVSLSIAEILEAALHVQGDRIINLGPNAVIPEIGSKRIAVSYTNHKLVVDVPAAGWLEGQCDSSIRCGFGRDKELTIFLGVSAASIRPSIKMRELHTKYRGLKRIQPAVDAYEIVIVLFLCTVRSQCSEHLSDFGIVCGEQAPVARAAQILGGIKTEATDLTEAPCPSPAILSANSLRCIFYNRDTESSSQLID